MADTKITALTAITTVDPANDVLPIVDVSDTSMAASGTTKKITTNQILGASGTATLASATITGDLTVDTNTLKVDSALNKVGVGVATLTGLQTFNVAGDVGITSDLVLKNSGGTVQGYIFGSSGINYRVIAGQPHVWQEGGSDLMRLNSTGLGVGSAPSGSFKITAFGSASGVLVNKNAANQLLAFSMKNSTQDYAMFIDQDGVGSNSWSVFDNTNLQTAMRYYPGASGYWHFLTNNVERLRIDSSGQVGIGVQPSAWVLGKVLEVGQLGNALWSPGAGDFRVMNNAFYGSGPAFKYAANGFATMYQTQNGQHQFHTAPSGTAGNAITWTQAMTLDASGNLLVGVTSGGTARLDIRTSTSQRIINAFSTAAGDSSTYGVYIAKFANDSTTAQRFIGFTINNDGAGSGQINANGASQAAFGTFSDSRLKENIVSLPSQLANILSLRPVEFDYKDGSGHQIGFVAQEMQQVYSDAVGESDGFLTVTGWSKTEARLVSAIKELAAKVQALEAKLA